MVGDGFDGVKARFDKFFIIFNKSRKLVFILKSALLNYIINQSIFVMKIYNFFEEVELEIEATTPLVIYKFRNWENDFHKKIITENEAWFAHPNSLNDPYDIRPPYNFIANKIDLNVARRKIKEAGKSIYPDLSEEKLDIEVEKRIIEIQNDPVSYFQKNRKDYLHNIANFNNIGVFSCCSSFSNEAMWAHYGNNHYGFALGFNTVELARTLNCWIGHVKYCDKPIDYNILGDNVGLVEKEIFQKSTKWSYEEEVRFLTLAIQNDESRARKFPINAVKEIVFGMTTSIQVQDEIISIAKEKLSGIPCYKVETNPDQFGFRKIQIG